MQALKTTLIIVAGALAALSALYLVYHFVSVSGQVQPFLIAS
jgi:hypothetical protein